MNYYNDTDLRVVQWLKNLIDAGIIPDGDVDSRSIAEVQPGEVRPYTQCHFFAGIAGWPIALALAGWPSTRPVWTGSCPCQPFSIAGRQTGDDDHRHLWPHFYRLIAQCGPPVVFGEQVTSTDGRLWLAGVRTDLEAAGYAVGAADLCAAGIGAPHLRQRLWWVADSPSERRRSSEGLCGPLSRLAPAQRSDRRGAARGVADARHPSDGGRRALASAVSPAAGTAKTHPGGDSAWPYQAGIGAEHEPGHGSGFWSDYELIACLDGKARRVESGTAPLVDGVPGRMVKIRAYGNAIVPPVAAEFVTAYLEAVETS